MEIVENNNDQIDKLDKIISNINLEEIHNNEVKKIYNKDFIPIKTPKYMTMFEYTAIIGKRSSQIQDNAPILINDYDGDDSSITIAIKELKKGVIPFIIRRPLPDNTFEDIKINNLIIKEEY